MDNIHDIPQRRPVFRFTPEALADMRYRVVETDEPRPQIAADYGIHVNTLYRFARKYEWPMRKDRAPRDVPAVRKSILAAESSAQAQTEAIRSQSDELLSLVDRLERAVATELSALELFRITHGMHALTPVESERITRTLERLTATLSKVERLRASAAPSNSPTFDYDMPEDIDAFRDELARQIEAFVASRGHEIDEPPECGEPDPALNGDANSQRSA